MSGFVYILTNTGLPGVVKIGMTEQDPRKRVRQVKSETRFTHGQNGDFQLAYFCSCPAMRSDCEPDGIVIESALHAMFHEHWIGYPELFQVDVEVVRSAMERLCGRPAFVGDPHRTGLDCWPFRRPTRSRRGNIPNGGPIYGWMMENRHAISERVASPDFSWLAFAHELRERFMGDNPRYIPVPPDMVQDLWQRVCGICARDFETLNRGFLGHSRPERARSDAA